MFQMVLHCSFNIEMKNKMASIPYFENLTSFLESYQVKPGHPQLHLQKLEELCPSCFYNAPPFRANTFAIALLTSGELVMTVNEKHHHLQRNDILLINPWHIC